MKFSRMALMGAVALVMGSFVAAEAAEIEQVAYRYRSRTKVRIRGRIRGRVATVVPATACCPSSYLAPGHRLAWEPSYGPGAVAAGVAPPITMLPDVEPPPGTLGRTYQLRTRPVPADKHPRVAMLDIRVPDADEVLLVDLNEFREEDYVDGFRDEEDKNLWRFETKPLINGIPHIYRVELRKGRKTVDVRYVRLVRGRILETEF